MELLQEVANISGKPGLYRIVKPGRAGVIVETLDAQKKKELIPVNAKVSVLKDISIYTEQYDKSVPLADLFLKIRELFGAQVEMDVKSANATELFDFMAKILPDFDRERVYSSDVKKIIQWYNILSVELPGLFEAPTAESEEA
ncbi:MAG: DUF5606 domain-containing protein [Spirosomataceae bacterium]